MVRTLMNFYCGWKTKSNAKISFLNLLLKPREKEKKDLLSFRGVITNKQTSINIPTTFSISFFLL